MAPDGFQWCFLGGLASGPICAPRRPPLAPRLPPMSLRAHTEVQLPFAILPLIHFTSDKELMGDFALGSVSQFIAYVRPPRVSQIRLFRLMGSTNTEALSRPGGPRRGFCTLRVDGRSMSAWLSASRSSSSASTSSSSLTPSCLRLPGATRWSLSPVETCHGCRRGLGRDGSCEASRPLLHHVCALPSADNSIRRGQCSELPFGPPSSSGEGAEPPELGVGDPELSHV